MTKSPDKPLSIEPGREYILENGMRFRVYAVDGGGINPVHGAFWSDVHERWQLLQLGADGSNQGVIGGGWSIKSLAPRKVKVNQRFVLVDKGDGTGALLSPTYVGPFIPGDTYKGGKIIGSHTITLNVEVDDS